MSSGLGLRPPTDPPSLEGLEFDDRIEVMAEWFRENFEDPAQETPYESAEGGYQYIWGGPYDAREELVDAFPEAAEEEVQAAVEEVQSDGLFDWAPAGRRIQPEDESYVPDIEEPPLAEQLAALGGRLDVVEAWLNALEKPIGGMGHNRPPIEFQLAPDDQDIADLRNSIVELRLELAKPDPANDADAAVVERADTRFSKFFRWLRNAALGVIGIFAAGYIGEAGSEAWQDPHKFMGHVAEITSTLSNWLGHLQLPF